TFLLPKHPSPRSTLFPYTTLFRSHMAEATMIAAPEEALTPREIRLERAASILRWGAIANGVMVGLLMLAALLGGLRAFPTLFDRSEEHTSELQSRENLVCRLLLEK